MNMNKDLPDIEELFKSALEDNEEFPSSKVWDDIENILDKDDVILIRRKYENLKRISFLLFFLLLGISIYQLNNWHSKANLPIINKKFNPDQKIISTSIDKRMGISPDPNDKISLNSNTRAEAKNVKPLVNKNASGNYFKINVYGNRESKNLKQTAIGDTKRNNSAQNFDNANAIKSKENLFVKSTSPVETKNVIIKDTAGTTKVIGLLNRN